MSQSFDLSRPKTSRVEAFSDGVFAIIITLLVLEIKVPHLQDAMSTQEAMEALRYLLPKFLSFVISFFYIAIFWVNHHHLFMVVTHTNRGLIWLNNLVLLFLTIIPFPTAFIGDYPQNSVALAFFAGILMMAAIAFNVMLQHAIHKKLLLKEAMPEIVRHAKKGFLGPVMYAVAAIAAFWMPVVAWAIFIILPMYYFLPTKWTQQLEQN